MKLLPPGMQAHLDSGATTLCWCWRLSRRDGVTLGFTDHDRDLTFVGTTFEAASGFSATEIKDAVGLSVDNLDVDGALQSGRLDERHLASGAFDNARIEIYRVNWQAPNQRVLMRTGTIGEVKRSGCSFTAEVRGLAQALGQPQGRLFQYTCDADLGDARCGVDLSDPSRRATGTVTTILSESSIRGSGLGAFTANAFDGGVLTFASGANAGVACEIKRHTVGAGGADLTLWHRPAAPVAAGDGFVVSVGCDKSLATCRDRFANVANFRGFPHMPGNDFVVSIARRS